MEPSPTRCLGFQPVCDHKCLTPRAPNGLSIICRDKVGRKRGSVGDACERWLEAENLKTSTEVRIFPWTGKIRWRCDVGELDLNKISYALELTYGCLNSAFEHLADIILTNYTSETKAKVCILLKISCTDFCCYCRSMWCSSTKKIPMWRM